MNRLACLIVIVSLSSFVVVPISFAAEPSAQALLFSKSTGFEHQPISEKDGAPNQVELVLRGILGPRGITLTATKDARVLSPEGLKPFSLVVFYTQGDFSVPGVDGAPAIQPGGVDALLDWIRAGGGFVGFHSATDTLRTNANQPATPYTEMIGASFRGHGRQFRGTVRVVDSGHPTMANLPDGFSIVDEWYVFRQINTERIRVLALLDPGPEREKQKLYNIDPYPIVWCRTFGAGRVYQNAMGHRTDVWQNETFLKTLADAMAWAGGDGPAGAEPNYSTAVGISTDD